MGRNKLSMNGDSQIKNGYKNGFVMLHNGKEMNGKHLNHINGYGFMHKSQIKEHVREILFFILEKRKIDKIKSSCNLQNPIITFSTN